MGFQNCSRFRKNWRLYRVTKLPLSVPIISMRFCLLPLDFFILYSMNKLREEVAQADASRKKKELENSKAGFGYGGKFGVESDR